MPIKLIVKWWENGYASRIFNREKFFFSPFYATSEHLFELLKKIEKFDLFALEFLNKICNKNIKFPGVEENSYIEKLNKEGEERYDTVVEKLLHEHATNVWIMQLFLKFFTTLLYYFLVYRPGPLYLRGRVFFTLTPSIYTVYVYHKLMSWPNSFFWGSLFLFHLVLRTAVLQRIYRSSHAESIMRYFSYQIYIHEKLLRLLGINQRAIGGAKRLGYYLYWFFFRK